jgi:hypothetical protein
LHASSPLLKGGKPEPGTTLATLQDAIHAQVPADVDAADVTLIGVELEAWSAEAGDLPADAGELRSAIAQQLG